MTDGSRPYDVAVVGGGILGIATAMALMSHRGLSLVVLEAEAGLATHQTGHNSGVIHSGLYYKPGSSKAANCVTGRDLLYRFCEERGIAHDRCGKLVVATEERELPALAELERRGRANGLRGVRRLGPEEIREHEPAVSGIQGLLVPETGIVDYLQVTSAFAETVRAAGGEIVTGARVLAARRTQNRLLLETTRGVVVCRGLVNCAGLQADRVARLCGLTPSLQIIPFRGEYYELGPERLDLVRNLIYPVPDPAFPFLGVHFTRKIHGGVEAGPNAVLALKREGYRRSQVSAVDVAEMLRFRGFWRMAGRFWWQGATEVHRSLSKQAFVRALRKLVPSLAPGDVHPSGAGVRAQAVEPNGLMVDDFRIIEAENMIHVLNAPSPGATASISIGRTIAEQTTRHLGLDRSA